MTAAFSQLLCSKVVLGSGRRVRPSFDNHLLFLAGGADNMSDGANGASAMESETVPVPFRRLPRAATHSVVRARVRVLFDEKERSGTGKKKHAQCVQFRLWKLLL